MEGKILLGAEKEFDLLRFVKCVYARSVPQGMGVLHAKEGELSDADAQDCIDTENSPAVCMDYVHGRACKMTVFRDNAHLYVRKHWYDHSYVNYKELLAEFGVELPEQEGHPAGWGTAA